MCRYCQMDECPPGCPNYEEKYSDEVCFLCKEKIRFGEYIIRNEMGSVCHYDCADANMTTGDLAQWAGCNVQYLEEEEDPWYDDF